MSQVKKQFEAIYAVLEANSNKKVSTIMPQLLELMTKSGSSCGSETGSTFHKDDQDQVLYVYCYYHKRWEAVSVAEYGAKKGTATGLNSMCKIGVSSWTKQQRVLKKAKQELLTKVVSGDLAPEDIAQAQADLEEEAKVIVAREDSHGYDTLEEALNS